MRPCGILILTIIISRGLIAQNATYPQCLFMNKQLIMSLIWNTIAKQYVIQMNNQAYLQIAKTAQQPASTSESRAMAFFQSFVWYCVIIGRLHRTMRLQSFGKMPKTLSKRTRHSDRWAENSRFRLVSDLVDRRKMTQSQLSGPIAHGRPISFWSISGIHLGSMSQLLQRWQTEKKNSWQLL